MSEKEGCDVEIDVFIENNEWHEDVPGAENICMEACKNTLMVSGVTDHFNSLEVAITLADNDFIKDLNKRFRSKNAPTNVLAFPNIDITPQNYREFNQDNQMLGDIIISHGMLFKEANEQNKTIKDHLMHMVVHATLHLLGYNHETDTSADEMEKLEIEILKDQGVDNPYLLKD